ncbi:hypothetical protein B0H14DRAFT_3084142 [Mycena olivaceomarginata]|nr:hypothetical protein B0H14DRAFT_3084142 [Mycena olivaceomarginata]
MTDAYVEWSLAMEEKGLGGEYEQPEESVVEDTEPVWVVDLFSAGRRDVAIVHGDAYIASAYVRHGFMPCSPHTPSVVITLRALEIFRVMQLRCPRLGIQAFVRALCDLHAVPPRPYLGAQFSIAFDAYLSIRAEVDRRVRRELGRDTPNWRLKNTCPACLYKLEGEPKLTLPMLGTQDGNNSLKRFERRQRELFLPTGSTIPGASKERLDNRVAPGDFFLPRDYVEEFAKDTVDVLMRGFEEGAEEDEGTGCDERWENMKEDVTARAWGMYDETGIFPALWQKYGLAVIHHLIENLGEIAMGIDVGCQTGKMVKAHPRLSQLAHDNNFKCLVGSFHGLRHGRLCQVSNLAMYVPGMGLEDCEGCESYFSKSNALASTTRYSSVFHRHQAITTYMQHADTCDAYQGLSANFVSVKPHQLTFFWAAVVIGNKYRRALKLKAVFMSKPRDVFDTWLAREKEYLRTLTKEPLEETLEMEYYQKLVNLREHDSRCLQTAHEAYAEAAKQTRRLETQRRHAVEVAVKSLAAVQDLEVKLDITTRWVPGCEEWDRAAKLRALDQLQGLVVARLFELTKVNMSGTGYKLRKHIAKALQVRSKAVKSALERYNAAASAMTPVKPQLSWDEVVGYAFLAEFDLLREGREDIRTEPWALPAGRAAMDQHFKIVRAEEELERLNLEIPRLVTFMVDEESFLVARYRMERMRFNAVHMERLTKLSKEDGFTASITPGVSVSTERRVPMRDAVVGVPSATHAGASAPNTVEEEEEDGEEDGDAIDAFENIVRIAHDVEANIG